MRKSIWTVLLTALVALVAVGCAKEADLSDLKNKVTDLDKRVTALEDAVAKINNVTIPGFESLVNAVQNKISIVSVVEGDGEYTINFSDGTSATIKNGKDGNDGNDGNDAVAPEVSITLGEDGIYYWTVNGQLLKDEAGNPLPVTAKGDKGDQGIQGDKGDKGDKGDDGITPLFGTSSEGKVIVSYDGGETWKPLGFSVIDGSAFTSAYIDDEKSTEDYIVLVVGETEVQIPKEKTFSLHIIYKGDLTSVGAYAGETIGLEYEVEGASSDDKVTVDVLCTSSNITAKLQQVDDLSGYIIIKVPEADPEAATPAKVEGKVFVFADNNKGKTNIKVISLEDGSIAAVADVSAQAPAAGGEFELTVTTNREYNVNMDRATARWLSVVETKATHEDKLKIVAAENKTGSYRVGVVSINDDITGELIKDFTVVQQPSDKVATDIASVRKLADGASVAVKDAVVLAASKNGVLVGDEKGGYIYVALKDNVAVDRGDVVSFTGVKKTDETTGATYVEVSVIEDDDYEGVIPDLAVTHYSIASQQKGSTSIHTTFVASFDKDSETGVYVAVAFYGDTFVVADPLGSFANLEEFDGKQVIVEGYTNGGIPATEETPGVFEFILTGIKELKYTENPNWTLSFDKGTITNTVAGEGSNEWYGFAVVPASIIGEEGYSSVDELILDLFPYKQDDIQLDLLYNYASYVAYYGAQTVVSALMDDVISQQTSSVSGVPYGDYIAFAYGLEDGTFNLSGNYAKIAFTHTDPHVKADYTDFIGDWSVNGNVWKIEEKTAGESYTVTGLGLGDFADATATAYFTDGKFVIPEQSYNAKYTSSYGEVSPICLSGQFINEGYIYNGYPEVDKEPGVIMTIAKLDDGKFDITAGSSPTAKVPFTRYGFSGPLTTGSYVGEVYTIESAAMPTKIAPYVEIPSVYKEGFENASAVNSSWSFFDIDGDGYNWSVENGLMTSASYINKVGALNPDNWAFTPEISFAADNYLSFYVKGRDANYPEEHYAIYVMSEKPTASNLSSAVKLVEGDATAEFEQIVCQIPADFANGKGYIGFRHYNVTDMFLIDIDNVVVFTQNPGTTNVPSSVAPSSVKSSTKGHFVNVTNSISTNVKRVLGEQMPLGSLSNTRAHYKFQLSEGRR